jgi:probable HAF family extracellular repeat protein
MKSKTLTFVGGIVLLAALAAPVRLSAQKQIHYTVIDIGTLPDGTFSQAFGINNNGDVVGYSTLNGDTALHAFLWRKGVMTDLSTLAPTDTLPYSIAISINDNDEVVGWSETSIPDVEDFCGTGHSLVCLPVLWRSGAITALPTLGGTNGRATAINNRGQLAGVAENGEIDPNCQTPVFKPAVWEKGQVRSLSTAPFLNGFMESGYPSMNEKGQMVGVAITCDFSAGRPLLWYKNLVTDMGAFGAGSINNKGQATGTYFTDTGLPRGFIWENGEASDLGSLPGYPQVHGNGINNSGQITGQTCVLDGSSCTAFLWQNGAMVDLNRAVPTDSSLYMFDPGTINSQGQIVGLAFQKTTDGLVCCHAFLAIPNNNAVDQSENTTAVEHDEVAQHPKIIIPEIVRKMLEKQLGHRHHIPGVGPQ